MQELGEMTAILTGDPRDERPRHGRRVYGASTTQPERRRQAVARTAQHAHARWQPGPEQSAQRRRVDAAGALNSPSPWQAARDQAERCATPPSASP
jgi:hypothetical protein